MINITAKAVKEWNAHWAPAKRVLKEVLCERVSQDTKWGVQNHQLPDYYTILAEEFGEVGKAICEHRLVNPPKATLQDIRMELIQTAAVAVAMVECLDRNELSPTREEA